MSDSGGSFRQHRNPRGARPKGYSEEAVLSEDEVQRRVDLREAESPDGPHSDWIGGEEPTPETPSLADSARRRGAAAAAAAAGASATAAGASASDAGAATGAALATHPTLLEADPALAILTNRVEAVRRDRMVQDERRRQLWRDSATILMAVVVALLLGQVVLPAQTAVPGGSPTPDATTVAIGSVGPPVTLPPAATFGPIINPSLGIDATPTPIPVITMGPTPSPTPALSPSPSVRPTASIRPTPRPTVRPTVKPTIRPTPRPTPPPTPEPTPTPPPSVSISCQVILPLTVACEATVANIQGGSQNWSTDADGSEIGGGDGTNTVTYVYSTAGVHTISLTVTGDDGSTASDSQDIQVD